MPTRTYKAQVFTSQGSQAIRLPRALRLRSKIVRIQKTKAGLIVIDSKPHADRVREFAKLFGSCPGFPEVERLNLPEPSSMLRQNASARFGELERILAWTQTPAGQQRARDVIARKGDKSTDMPRTSGKGANRKRARRAQF